MTPCREQNKRWIDEAFGAASSVEEIVRRLEGMVMPSPDRPGRGEWAQTTLDSLAKASPTALKVLVTPAHSSWDRFPTFFSVSR